MPKTGAERQAAWRQRQERLAAALKADNARLRAELARVSVDLAEAHTEAGGLAGQACKHPAAAVEAGTCHACGTDV